MAVIRVQKNRNYTVMSNVHLKDNRLALKAKGLLSVCLALPDDWDYSIAGLVAICKENETAVKTAMKELKDCGYLTITKLMPGQTESGRIEYVYNIFETPAGIQEGEKQGVENLPLEIQPVENQGQLNTNISSTYKPNTKDMVPAPREKEPEHKYGEYHHVLLTDSEHQKFAGKARKTDGGGLHHLSGCLHRGKRIQSQKPLPEHPSVGSGCGQERPTTQDTIG